MDDVLELSVHIQNGGIMTTYRSARQRNTQAPLPESLDKRLAYYALAASAAGVGLLAAASPLQADILPGAPQSATIASGSVLTLHLGGANFVFENSYSSGTVINQTHLGTLKITGEVLTSTGGAVALSAGAKIGPSGMFLDGASLANAYGKSSSTGEGKFSGGNFGSAGDKFLGLKFDISGQAHFGWAELSVSQNDGAITAQLLGDAYEACPNTPIAAGATSSGPCSVPSTVPEPGTLGLLALGATGLFALRRKQKSPVSH